MFNFYFVHTLDPNMMLDICILFSIIFGLCTITSNNPMYSILYLIGLFISIAGYLYYINLGIMSLLYLLIYVGAIAILFLFILSLLDVKISELKAHSSARDFSTVIIVSVITLFGFYKLYNNDINLLDISGLLNYQTSSEFSELFNVNNGGINYNNIADIYYNKGNLPESLSLVLNQNWYNIHSINELSSIGYLLYTEYAILLILMGVILLLSIIGAIVITTSKK